jgi:hypothetical protein
MRVEDDPSDGPPLTSDYKPVEVKADSLVAYYRTMSMGISMAVFTSSMTAMSPMSPFVYAGLLGMGKDSDGSKLDQRAGVFAEGIVVAQHMLNNAARFHAFFKDVSNGAKCIGEAAGVIAETYGNTDAFNKAKLGDVAFAFADPNAAVPAGFPKGAPTKTFQEQESERANSSGQYAMALTMPISSAQHSYSPANGVTIYDFPDGSTLQVTTSAFGPNGQPAKTVTSEVFYQGKIVSKTEKSEYTNASGQPVVTTRQAVGSDYQAPGAVSTEVVTDSAGGQTVKTTTQTTDPTKPSVHETTVAPPPRSSSTDSTTGPIENWEKQYDTKGTTGYVEQHGAGY